MSGFLAERLGRDTRIERSIFGSDEPAEIWRQVLAACPAAVDCFAFEASVGALVGVRLEDGSRVALKFHTELQTETSLEAVQRVQAHLRERGFPCPRPLGVRGRATLEEWRDEGDYRDAHEPEVRRVLAEYLARLHGETAELLPLAGLEPFFPPADGPLWPRPHNVLFDFDATAAGAEWIDEIAAAAKPLRDAANARLVVGHGDWTVKHVRFAGLRPTVIYDWDSLNTDSETVFAGYAAATFTYTERLPVVLWPTAVEARAFLDDYEAAREVPFTPAERRAAAAAAVYSRAYSTRCVHALGPDAVGLQLEDYAAKFL